MANKLLGELKVKIGEEEYTLKPTFSAIMRMELETGKKLSELIDLIRFGTFGLRETVAVVYGGILGANGNREPKIKYSDLGDAVMQAGWLQFLVPCGRILGAAYGGQPVDDSELKDESEEKKIVENP